MVRKSEGTLIDIEDIGKSLHDMLSSEAKGRNWSAKDTAKRKTQGKQVEPPKAESSELSICKPIEAQVEKVDLPSSPMEQTTATK